MKTKKEQDKIVKFIEKHFDDAEPHMRGAQRKHLEYRILCPFCKGGRTGERSFDINVEEGATRCWRASCDWRGTVEWFVKHYLDISYPEAVDLIQSDGAQTLEELQGDLNLLEDQFYDKHFSKQDYKPDDGIDVWIDGSMKVQNSRYIEHVESWLKYDRGYDPDQFLEQHNIYMPPQMGSMDGRILFEVMTGENRAYLAYAWDDVEPKTLNPSGSVLSKMLYNYNNVLTSDVVFVCEGVFDVARIKSWGFSAVCIFGVNLSKEQIGLLDGLQAKEICICLDHMKGDKNFKLGKRLGQYVDTEVSIMDVGQDDYIMDKPFKEGLDPDDMTKKQFINYYVKRYKTVDEKDSILSKLMRIKRNKPG